MNILNAFAVAFLPRGTFLVVISTVGLLLAGLSGCNKTTVAVTSAKDDEPVINEVLRHQPLFIGEAITFTAE